MEKEEIIKKIEVSKNQPALMVDKNWNIKVVIIKLDDLEKDFQVITKDSVINYYNFDISTIEFQEWDEKSRDQACMEKIAVRDILSFYNPNELYTIVKNLSYYQKKNIEEDLSIAKTYKSNYIELSVFIPIKTD